MYISHAGSEKSLASLGQDADAIERAEPQSASEAYEEEAKEPEQRPSSLSLNRTASNVLTRVASRLTTHSIVNPPPPPDGGKYILLMR